MRLATQIIPTLAIVVSVTAFSIPKTSPTPKLVAQFSPPIWLENLVTLPNGTVVVCDTTNAALYGINPHSENPSPYPLHHFSESAAVFGITSPAPNILAVTASDFKFENFTTAPGTNKVYLLKLTRHGSISNITTFPVPTASWLNGLTFVPESPHILLLADCEAGAIIRLNTLTGKIDTISTDPLLAQNFPAQPIGINGIHAHDGFAYFTNSVQSLFGRIAITEKGLAVAGQAAEIIARPPNGSYFDDFVLDRDGTALVATTGRFNGILKIDGDGKETVVVNGTALSNFTQVTAVALGHGGHGGRGSGRRVAYFTGAGQFFQSPLPPIGGQLFSVGLYD